jgi:hypothetical protein
MATNVSERRASFLLASLTIKTEALRSPESSVTIYHLTRRNIPEKQKTSSILAHYEKYMLE